jgi:glucan-binding YG repeat protein
VKKDTKISESEWEVMELLWNYSHSSQEGKCKKSKSWNVTYEEASKISFGMQIDSQKAPGKSSTTESWINDDTGWKYCNTDGSNTVSNWQYINGKWYYFNEFGYMVTGWIHWKEMWYYRRMIEPWSTIQCHQTDTM